MIGCKNACGDCPSVVHPHTSEMLTLFEVTFFCACRDIVALVSAVLARQVHAVDRPNEHQKADEGSQCLEPLKAKVY